MKHYIESNRIRQLKILIYNFITKLKQLLSTLFFKVSSKVADRVNKIDIYFEELSDGSLTDIQVLQRKMNIMQVIIVVMLVALVILSLAYFSVR